MNPDERIIAYTERTKALTQKMELLWRIHQDNDTRFQGYSDRIACLMSRLAGIIKSLPDRNAG